jgi:chitin-binding protein
MKRIATCIASLLLAAVPAFGHGSMADPISRTYKIFLDNPQTPQGAAAAAAIGVAGTQAFYDWNEVSRLAPGYDYPSLIPDGQLPSAGRDKYAGLNLARTDWYATPVVAGPRECRFYSTTPHDPSFFKAYITRNGYDPRQPLRWSDLEPVAGTETALLHGSCGAGNTDCHCGTSGAGLSYYMTLQLPQRIGRHVLYVIWQRVDPNSEVFFSTSDLDYGGVDYGSEGAPPVIPAAATFSFSSQWTGGGQGAFTITNASTQTIRGWKLEFDWVANVNSLWNGVQQSHVGNHYVVTNADYNEVLLPGASVVVGCTATYAIPGLLPTSIAAVGSVPGAPPACDGDCNGDRKVDSADIGIMLGNWGQASDYDFDGDGNTNGADLAIALAAWGPCQ